MIRKLIKKIFKRKRFIVQEREDHFVLIDKELGRIYRFYLQRDTEQVLFIFDKSYFSDNLRHGDYAPALTYESIT